MPQFETDGASVHYQLAGTGTPLLMIAGTASDGASWEPLIPLLAHRFSLVMIDNRGSGRTLSSGRLALEAMAADCAALLGHLGIDRTDVAGHSLGGFLGLLLAATHPQKVRRLVTMGSGIIPASKRVLLRDMARIQDNMAAEDWFRLLYQWLFSERFFADEVNVRAAAAASASYPHRQSPADFTRQVAAIDRFGGADLSRVACPVLALAAEFDLLAPPDAVQILHRAVPQVTHELIAGAAHSVHWEAPEAVAEAVIGFFS